MPGGKRGDTRGAWTRETCRNVDMARPYKSLVSHYFGQEGGRRNTFGKRWRKKGFYGEGGGVEESKKSREREKNALNGVQSPQTYRSFDETPEDVEKKKIEWIAGTDKEGWPGPVLRTVDGKGKLNRKEERTS